MWKGDEVDVDPLVVTDQEMHTTIKVCLSSPMWIFYIVYASTSLTNRLRLWDNLKHFHNTVTGPWVLCGNFNEVTTGSEKFEGNQVNNTRINAFLECLQRIGMHDRLQWFTFHMD